jgi:hypothetical protein
MLAGEQHNFFGESVFRGILLKCNGSSCVSCLLPLRCSEDAITAPHLGDNDIFCHNNLHFLPLAAVLLKKRKPLKILVSPS